MADHLRFQHHVSSCPSAVRGHEIQHQYKRLFSDPSNSCGVHVATAAEAADDDSTTIIGIDSAEFNQPRKYTTSAASSSLSSLPPSYQHFNHYHHHHGHSNNHLALQQNHHIHQNSVPPYRHHHLQQQPHQSYHLNQPFQNHETTMNLRSGNFVSNDESSSYNYTSYYPTSNVNMQHHHNPYQPQYATHPVANHNMQQYDSEMQQMTYQPHFGHYTPSSRGSNLFHSTSTSNSGSTYLMDQQQLQQQQVPIPPQPSYQPRGGGGLTMILDQQPTQSPYILGVDSCLETPNHYLSPPSTTSHIHNFHSLTAMHAWNSTNAVAANQKSTHADPGLQQQEHLQHQEQYSYKQAAASLQPQIYNSKQQNQHQPPQSRQRKNVGYSQQLQPSNPSVRIAPSSDKQLQQQAAPEQFLRLQPCKAWQDWEDSERRSRGEALRIVEAPELPIPIPAFSAYVASHVLTCLGLGCADDGQFTAFIESVLLATEVGRPITVLALYYLHALLLANPDLTITLPGREYKLHHRIFITILLMSNKILDDHTFTNRTWSDLSKIPVEVVNDCERVCLGTLGHGLLVGREEFSSWINSLQREWNRPTAPPTPVSYYDYTDSRAWVGAAPMSSFSPRGGGGVNFAAIPQPNIYQTSTRDGGGRTIVGF